MASFYYNHKVKRGTWLIKNLRFYRLRVETQVVRARFLQRYRSYKKSYVVYILQYILGVNDIRGSLNVASLP
jgi:hypothetical protein